MRTILAISIAGLIMGGATYAYAQTNAPGGASLNTPLCTLHSLYPGGQGVGVGASGSEAAAGCYGCPPCGCYPSGACKPCALLACSVPESSAVAPGVVPPGTAVPGPLLPQFGMSVVPTMRLSADDVRAYLTRTLTGQGFDRLKVGAVEEVDDDTVTAEIVTADDSLVQRLEIDRYTGSISRGN